MFMTVFLVGDWNEAHFIDSGHREEDAKMDNTVP
jgi:hypothetical protein